MGREIPDPIRPQFYGEAAGPPHQRVRLTIDYDFPGEYAAIAIKVGLRCAEAILTSEGLFADDVIGYRVEAVPDR